MYQRLRPLGLILFAVCVLAVSLAAQMEEKPHPIFNGLEVGQRYDIRWSGGPGRTGYCEISDSPGTDQIVELGSDYFVYRETDRTFAVPLAQIKFVTIRTTSLRR